MFPILCLIFGATLIAFWISAICGGGASLILIPILNWVLPSSIVPFSLTIGTFASSASRIVVFKKHIKWKIFLWFVPFSIPAVFLGAWLIKFLNPMYLQLIIAVFLILNTPELFRSRTQQKKEEKPFPKFILAIVGFFAGFVSGITGAIGLLFNRFYLRYGLTKEEIVATRAANEIFLHFIKLFIYISLGLFSIKGFWIGLTIAIAAVVSSYSVKYILPFLSEYLFRKIGYAAMVVSGFFLLGSTIQTIINKDHISFSTNRFHEQTINWRHSSFVLEFSFDGGIEVEEHIQPKDLPENLKEKYNTLTKKYDFVYIEKVYQLKQRQEYEFYCIDGKRVIKIET